MRSEEFSDLFLLLLRAGTSWPREARQEGLEKPRRGAHMDVRRFRRHRMCLTEIPGPLADPAATSPGAPQGGFLLVTFLCRSKKSDSRKARNALLCELNSGQSKLAFAKVGSSHASGRRTD